MKINRKDIPAMTLEQFADLHNLQMEVHERGRPEGDPARYYAHFAHCEVVGDGVLISEFGDGSTPEEAIACYAEQITLKRIVIGAYTSERRELSVPRLIPNAVMSGNSNLSRGRRKEKAIDE